MEKWIAARACLNRRRVARRAADRTKHLFAEASGFADGSAGNWRQELHEAGEVVDAAAPGPRIALVFDVRDQVARSHAIAGDANGKLLREEVVGDPHFVAIGIGAEREQ